MSSKYSTNSKEYHKEYYKKHRIMLKYKRDLNKPTNVSEDVVAWKVMMQANPNCFYPFAKSFDCSTNSLSSSCGSQALKFS
jgi:hypothetical protein